jgi:hypothetical protein
MPYAQNLNGIALGLPGSPVLSHGQTAQAIVQVGLHVQVVKKTGLLEHVGQATLPNRGEQPLIVVLPHL